MAESGLDRLLTSLDVAIEVFAILEIQRNQKLVFEGVDAFIIHYVLEGSLILTGEDGQEVTCRQNQMMIIPPNMPQAIAFRRGTDHIAIAAKNCSMVRDGLLLFDASSSGPVDLRIACGVVIPSISGSFGLLDRISVPMVEDAGDNELIRVAFDVMRREVVLPALGTRALTGALMKSCLLLILRRLFEGTSPQDKVIIGLQDPKLGLAVATIIDRPGETHTVASLAAIAGMSRSVFARDFSAKFAMAPMGFVAKTRLHHAAQMLRSTALPVKVIAFSIGYSSRSHFSRAFRAAYQQDPSGFRKDARKTELDAPRNLHGSRDRFALPSAPQD